MRAPHCPARPRQALAKAIGPAAPAVARSPAPPVAGLLNHTTKWLTQAATQLIAPSASCSDTLESSSSAGPSPSDAAVPEPLSPAMVLSQGFLNLLTWDPDNEEFPEVGKGRGEGAFPCFPRL